MLGKYLDEVRKKVPLVHNITNYVTVNDVANVLLACGGSPIMSDEPRDVEDITSICGGLNINLGTLNKRSIKGMKAAGKKAQELGHVILLDPVGAGASALRTETAAQLMDMIKFTVIRGNISEIKTIALGSGTTKGVDADVADAVQPIDPQDIPSAHPSHNIPPFFEFLHRIRCQDALFGNIAGIFPVKERYPAVFFHGTQQDRKYLMPGGDVFHADAAAQAVSAPA